MIKLPSLAVLRHRDFRIIWFARILAIFALQMQALAIGWQVYDLARKTMDVPEAAFLLGMVGLAQFVPLFFLSLIGGQAADRYERKLIILLCFGAEALIAGVLLYSTTQETQTALILCFVAAAGLGAVRGFMPAAMSAVGPMLVPRDELPQAIALNSLAFQGSSIAGPALGGFVFALGANVVYASAVAFLIGSMILTLQIRTDTRPVPTQSNMWTMISEGLVYVRDNKIVLGAISLDLFVVLLAGATALLPVFARDILHAGPHGLGLLRASPAIGAAIVAFALAVRPLETRLGYWMFGAVGVFGACMIAFGLSTTLWVAMIALIVSGMADMVSVFVRQSLVQLATPDAMRGRVSAVSMIFISASNELGEFQSGVAARFLGPIPAVVAGGVGGIVVALMWMRLFPQLAKTNTFHDAELLAVEPGDTAPKQTRST